ncbi:hypothetical protein LCGC14_1240090, partial [marine sediment metagenome]
SSDAFRLYLSDVLCLEVAGWIKEQEQIKVPATA